jgi:phosphoenolpyruvate-protein kinase (PTS system EI component)
MNMLYDSESFVVVHIQSDVPPSESTEQALTSDQTVAMQHWAEAAHAADDAALAAARANIPMLVRHGFEIVDKRSGKEIFLDGSWAEMFQQQIVAWQERTPTQEEVEDTLERYTALAHTPVVVH